MDNNFQKLVNEYLTTNPERLNVAEKVLFQKHLQTYFDQTPAGVDDDVYDFLNYVGIIPEPRYQSMQNMIMQNYPVKKFPKILEVGAGHVCHLGQALGAAGYQVTAMDPEIRLTDTEIKEQKLPLKVSKKLFWCDEYAPYGMGTDLRDYDLIIGLEPCEATEHILRQALKYRKPALVSLCYQNHSTLDGTKFATPGQWYVHLSKIDPNIKINMGDHGYLANIAPQKLHQNTITRREPLLELKK